MENVPFQISPVEVTKETRGSLWEIIATLIFGLIILSIILWTLNQFYDMKAQLRWHCQPIETNNSGGLLK